MNRILKYGAVGFLAGAVLEFLVVGCVLSAGDPYEDSTQYAGLIALLYSPLAGVVGGMIGVTTGAAMDWRARQRSHRRLFCLVAGILLLGVGFLGLVLRSLGLWQPTGVECIGLAVIGLVLCFAVVLAPHHNKKKGRKEVSMQ